MKGRIFDIKKFAVHDGPGIRSTVFLKGCPLRCVWCQNPEGLELSKHLWYFENRCIKCHKCLNTCPQNALSLGTDLEAHIVINQDICELSGACIDMCPTNALTFDSREVTVEEVVTTLMEDLPFYNQSGGGITLSGGDPIYQADFSLAILKACKEKGLHTTVETSMYTTQAIFREFFDLVDYFIVDIKLFDPTAHKKFIGQDNQMILDNFKTLTKADKPILVRIPIIPGITDSDLNIRQIARYVHTHGPNVSIELINYNPFADNKYRLMHQTYDLSGTQPLDDKAMQHLYALVEEAGVSTLNH